MRNLIIASTAVIVVLGALAGAYFSGIWIPNDPSPETYPVRGIGVSHHQGPIQWDQVTNASVHFAYIKATEGKDFTDSRFKENWAGAAEAGIVRGAYHFFTLRSPGTAQAAHFCSVVPVDPEALPPAVDLEFAGNSAVRPTVSVFQKELDDFLAVLRSVYGKEPVIYTTRTFQSQYLREYPIPRLWYRSVVFKPFLKNSSDWVFWQYSMMVKVPGIQGRVDQNVFRGDMVSFRAFVAE